jgi:hypothetical protein
MEASNLVVLFYITAVLFTLQQLTFRIQAVSESAHVTVQLIILKYSRDKSWGFPVFIYTRDQPEARCRSSSRSNFMVSSRTFLSPFLIFEIVSDDDESYPLCMLLEAIAIAQAGQYMTRQKDI